MSGLVDSDPHRIRQIVNNLVTNAIRYTETGTVRVQLRQRPAVLIFVVSDTGPGVPQAQIPLIFQEFTQLDASRTRRFEGAGMGLAIVQGLVEAVRRHRRGGEHGGRGHDLYGDDSGHTGRGHRASRASRRRPSRAARARAC